MGDKITHLAIAGLLAGAGASYAFNGGNRLADGLASKNAPATIVCQTQSRQGGDQCREVLKTYFERRDAKARKDIMQGALNMTTAIGLSLVSASMWQSRKRTPRKQESGT